MRRRHADPGRDIRVVHVVDSLEPGGMENGVANVAGALAGTGFEIHACCLRNRGEFAERMPDPSLVNAIGKDPGFSWRWVRALRDNLRAISPDIVHTHNLGPLIYAAGATRLGRRYRLVHGEHAEFSPAECTSGRLRLRRLLYRSCAAIHTVSTGLTENLRSAGMPMGKITTIANGVDTMRFSTDTGTPPPLCPFPGDPRTMTILGIVGRFGEFKRHLDLLAAFESLCADKPELRLLVVGDGGPMKRATLAKIEASPFREKIHWAGFQSEPAGFYRMMDLLIVPSSNEGLSNACLEALACGTPVLANASCGSQEALAGCPAGRVTSMPSRETLASAIIDRIRDIGHLRELRPLARQHVVENFSMPGMVEAYRQLYEGVLT